jgi:hypothetical protein
MILGERLVDIQIANHSDKGAEHHEGSVALYEQVLPIQAPWPFSSSWYG